MRCRLCCGFRTSANFRTAGDNDDDIADDTVCNHAVFDWLILDCPIVDFPILDHPVRDVAPSIAAQDDDDGNDCAGNDRAGGGFAFDDTATAGRATRRPEGGHDRPFGVGAAPPDCGPALRI
jgi:hypothetical protein